MKKDIAIKVENVSKSFKLPHNKQSSLKGTLISLVSRGDRTYETQEVLRNVSFEIKKGEFFGIVGRNGSGKSTLLKMIAGIYEPTEGSITINGSLTPFIELGVGFNPELTGRENVYMNGALLGFNNKEVDEMYDGIVGFAELERFMDQKLKNYSSGMQVRLAFSIAIRARSDILVLDEVLAVGDAAFQQKCFDYFEMLKEQKQTVVLVTHDMSAVERFCKRAMLIEKGEIKVIGGPGVVADTYREENIETRPGSQSIKDKPDHRYKLKFELKDAKDGAKSFVFSHDYPEPNDVYVGFTIFRDGMNISELVSSEQNIPSREFAYTLDTKLLNAGAYEVSAALFMKKNRALIAVCDGRRKFVIRGMDKTRGSALKLDHTWEEA